MKIYFKETGFGRNFISIQSSEETETFLKKYNIEYSDYGDHLRISDSTVVVVDFGNSIECIQQFCEENNAHLTLTGKCGIISFYSAE